jgi:hypothetical protein
MSSLLLVAACSRRVDIPTPGPVPEPVEPPTPVVEARTLLMLAPDSATYDAHSTVVTVERSGTGLLPDSASYSETIQATLVTDLTSRYRLKISSDSGYRLPADRQPPPETVRKDSAAITNSQLLGGNEAGESIVRDTAAPCSSKPSLVSPLLTSVLARYLLTASTSDSVRPTRLQYTICSAGVLRTVSGVLEYDVGQHARDRSTVVFAIQAAIHADSSRALPMRISGTMKGNVTIQSGRDAGILPPDVELRLTSDINAASSSKSQHFEQRVTTRLLKRD